MFDVSWSELLILGLVTLIFVGPKELPRFLNTLGRYLGVVRRQANEFRSVFEQALREAEMDEIQKEMRAVSDGVKASLDEATRSVDSVKQAARVEPPSTLGTTGTGEQAGGANTAPAGGDASAGEPGTGASGGADVPAQPTKSGTA